MHDLAITSVAPLLANQPVESELDRARGKYQSALVTSPGESGFFASPDIYLTLLL